MSQVQQHTDEYGSTSELVWLDDTACADTPYGRFFVDAGHAIDPETLRLCRGCPVRRHCVTWAYLNGYSAGYFGGFSPSQRRSISLREALRRIDRDAARPSR